MKNNCSIKMLLGFCCLMLVCIQNGIVADNVSSSHDYQKDLSLINEEIAYLEEVKARYLALALIHEEQAMRWQFDPHLKQEARRSLRLADAERRVIQEIQLRVDDLCAQRNKLLKRS